MNKDAIRTVNAVKEIGQRQFSEYVNIALSDIVAKNKLALFSTPQTKQRSRSKEQVASLKTNCTLNEMLNKVLTTRKYSSWDRCQGLGRGCNCAYGQARGLSNI